MAKTARAVLHREPDGQYSTFIFSREDQAEEIYISAAHDQLLAVAFNYARDQLAAQAHSGEIHRLISISTRIT